MKKKLHIENLPPKMSADDLYVLCEPYGTVARIKLTDEAQDGSRRSGYV